MGSQTKTLPIAALQQRLDELHQQTATARRRTLTEDEQGRLVEQLQFALRELSMAEEELRRQDEALVRARRVADEERRHFQRLFDLAFDGYVITDLAGTIREANRTASSLLRSEDSVLIGRSFSSFLLPTEQVTFFTRLMRLRAHVHTETWETQLQSRTGQPIGSLTISATSERTENGEVLYWVLHGPAERIAEKLAPQAASVQERTADIRGITPAVQAEIEERQRAEAALREGEERYRELFENANDMITTIALDGTFVSVNRKTEQLLGYTREELIGQDSHKFATPASAAVGDERTRRVFAGETVPPIFALELVRRDGTIVPVEARIRFIRDQAGKPIGFHGIYRDVTERKRAEEALRKAHDELEDRVQVRTEELVRANTVLLVEVEERKRAEEAARAAEAEYRSIFENATEGIYRSSIDGHQIRANPALVKLNGYSSEEEQIAGVNDIATEWYVDPHRRDEFKRLLEERERVTNFESEIYRHKTRERIWISENARLVRDKIGNPLYYEGTVQDITARKRAEEALRQAHAELERRVQERTAELTRTNDILLAEVAERQRTALALDQLRCQHESILNSAGEGIVGTDLEGKAIFVNPGAARLLNREVDELIGHSLHLLMHHSKPNGMPYPIEECPFLTTLREGQVVHVTDEVFWRKDGTAFPVECLSTPIRSGEGDIIGAVVTFRDITQRKEVDRLKDELISTVSHELRTPLTSLRGFAELLLERQFPLEKQQDFVSVIHKESLRLTNLINDFLDLQRIEAGRQPYFFATVAVEPLICDTVAVFTKEGDPHVLRLDLPTALPLVYADADRLRQVLTNLLSNAIKFSPKGGEVVVGARHEGGNVVLWVQDHGIGIPEDAFPKLFNKFYRIDNRATRNIGGTGLGLALVKELISAHQGRVWVESQVGVGSTFFFTVPVAVEEQQV